MKSATHQSLCFIQNLKERKIEKKSCYFQIRFRKIDDQLTNEEAWQKGKWLVAGNKEYHVVMNPPTVTSVCFLLLIS